MEQDCQHREFPSHLYRRVHYRKQHMTRKLVCGIGIAAAGFRCCYRDGGAECEIPFTEGLAVISPQYAKGREETPSKMPGFLHCLHFIFLVAAITVEAQQYRKPVDTSNENVKKAANFATSIYNQQSGNEFAFKVIKIDLASVEIFPPSRVKYIMTVDIGKTHCKNEDSLNMDSCVLQTDTDAKLMKCLFVVLGVPNSNMPSYLLDSSCN
ncbi:uncharacterized protein zgc:194981 isoform X2 [Polypterus senegalus]|uniref:uncharacterized protein zgc:194981 isoform X2 n=1 Tax=Polypterus senegalus TaxID=55291 RepID=UPI001965EBFF|nr:uncharacterized protein zgc:194981 isoform X2 [Polypterus senegalus]